MTEYMGIPVEWIALPNSKLKRKLANDTRFSYLTVTDRMFRDFVTELRNGYRLYLRRKKNTWTI